MTPTHTEEDTFNRLRRIPFRQVFISILDPVMLGDSIVPEDRYPRIQEAGWTREEFEEVLLDEISNGNITGSVTVLQKQDWREKFLTLPPIL